MDNKTESRRDVGFVLSEANGHRSRENTTIAAGEGILEPGTVLGTVTATGKRVASPPAAVIGKEGAEAADAVLAYRVDATAADIKAVVIARDAEVIAPELVYEATVDTPAEQAAKQDQLAAVGVIAR